MPSPTSEHRGRLQIGMLMLLLALIGWGLQFNVSRFGEKQLHAPPIPPGKLLLDADQGAAVTCAVACRVSLPPVRAMNLHVLAAVCGAEPECGHDDLQPAPQVIPPKRCLCARYFLRPPPSLA